MSAETSDIVEVRTFSIVCSDRYATDYQTDRISCEAHSPLRREAEDIDELVADLQSDGWYVSRDMRGFGVRCPSHAKALFGEGWRP